MCGCHSVAAISASRLNRCRYSSSTVRAANSTFSASRRGTSVLGEVRLCPSPLRRAYSRSCNPRKPGHQPTAYVNPTSLDTMNAACPTWGGRRTGVSLLSTLNSFIPSVEDDRDKCQASAEAQRQPSAELIHRSEWGGRGSNPRPTDYESVSATKLAALVNLSGIHLVTLNAL